MKKLLALLGFTVLVSAAQAQTITITDTHPNNCVVYFEVTYQDANTNTYIIYNKVLGGMTQCYNPGGTGGCSSLSGTAPHTFISAYIHSIPGLCVPSIATSPCPNANSTTVGTTGGFFPTSDCFEVTNCNACLPGNVVNALWTDLGAGNVQLDFN